LIFEPPDPESRDELFENKVEIARA
jgi:hypothetical protein